MKHETLLRLPEVLRRCGCQRLYIHRRVADGSFPKPVKIGKKYVVWPESEIDAWIAKQIADHRQAA